MAFPDVPMSISPNAQQAVVQYIKSSLVLFNTQYNIREQLRARDLAYYRENDLTTEQQRAKSANARGDSTKLQNITVPVVMPQTESSLTYLTQVFLSGYPIFASYAPPGQEDAMEMMDAITTDNSKKFGWVSNLMKTMRNGLKYDLGVCEVAWEKRKVASVLTPEMKKLDQGTPTEEWYSGNVIRDLDPYNVILDPRVSPEKNYLEGEFAGYSKILSRINCLKHMADLDKSQTMNFKAALESGVAQVATTAADSTGYYIPQINPDALIPADSLMEFDWLKWAALANPNTGSIAYRNSYLWTILYARILPRDFGIRGKDVNQDEVQIWKFIVINAQVVIFAQRMTNAHDYLPILVCKPSNDGMGYQSKSFSQNVEPFQAASTSLFNSGLASQRRKVYDRILYDPLRVNKADIENVSPVARIPVRNAQMGKGLNDAVAPMPYRDDGVAEILQMSQTVVQMAEIAGGQNRVTQGQFQKGNKTRREFDVVMNNSSARPQMMALGLEDTFFTPMKEIIKANVLQYQPAMKIVPDPAEPNEVTVDPDKLRKALLEFQLSDGLIPIEKMASLDVAGQVVQAATAVPMIQQEYDVMGILDRTWALQGLRWIKAYKRTPDQLKENLALQAQMTAAGAPPQPGASPTAAPDAGAMGAA